MKRNLAKLMYPLMLVYLGLALFIVPFVLYDVSYRTVALVTSLSTVFIFLGVSFFSYEKLSRKIDETMNAHKSMESVGINQIIPSSSRSIERIADLLSAGSKVNVIVDIDRLTDGFDYFIKLITYEYKIDLDLLITGKPRDRKHDIFLDDMCYRTEGNKYLRVRINSHSSINNTFLFNEKKCITHYSNSIIDNMSVNYSIADFDSKSSVYIVFQAPSEIYSSHTKIFDVLWDRGKPIGREGIGKHEEEM